MPIVVIILTLLAAYLLGSIPSGYLAGRARGIDIRAQGSGNIGATNVTRILGKRIGILVLVADAAKGWLSVYLLPLLIGWLFLVPEGSLLSEWLLITAGVGAVLGHNYTCWLNFKGGKGVATSAGVLLGWVPLALVIVLAVFLVVLIASRFVSLASISASVALPFATWVTSPKAAMIAVTGGLAILAIYKHRANISRLLNGTEPRFGSPPSTKSAESTKSS
jgi:acyl phosphate:glycerol-3-phosphate acyltransferase